MPPSKRNELIDAAMHVFYREGFHASGIDRVLQEGGLSRMTLYNHFKSKDELMLAALRRRDEIFRQQMMKFVESATNDPEERILAVFDFLGQWFSAKDFCGCMFINASAEHTDPKSGARRIAAEHLRDVGSYIERLCRDAGIEDAAALAGELGLLVCGAIVSAKVVGQVIDGGAEQGASARVARSVAEKLVELRRAG